MRSKGHRPKKSSLGWLRGLRISILFVLLAALLVFDTAEARDDIVPGSRYTPAAAQALGDAYLPFADDVASALFYNPAGLGLMKGVHMDFFNLQLYGNSGYFGNIELSKHDFYKVTDLKQFDSTLSRNPGTWQGIGYTFAPAFYVKGIGFGLLVQEQVLGKHNTNNTVDYKSNYQLIPAVGGGLRLAEGIVRVGFSTQWVNQASGTVTGASTSGNLGYNQGLKKGSALSHTLGLAITMPYEHLPQFNLVGRNLFMARFRGSAIMPFAKDSSGTPASEKTSLDASISWVEKLGRGVELSWVFEDRDALNVSGVSFLGRFAVGLEMDFRHVFYLRGGWGTGYPDLGIGFRRKKHDLSVTWSNVEIGNGYHDQKDTRYVLQYQVRAF